MRRATASSGTPRAATYEPPSSQLPRWPVTTISPRPCASARSTTLPPVDLLEQLEHLLARVGRQQRRLDRRAPEMRVRRARDARDLRLVEPGKRGAHLPLDDRAPDAERPVAEHADPLADRAGALEAQPAQRGRPTPRIP